MRKFNKFLLSALLSALLVVGNAAALLTPVQADDVDKYKQQYDALQKDLERTNADLKKEQANVSSAEKLLAKLNEQMDLEQAQQKILVQKAQALAARVADAETRVKELSAKVDKTKQQVGETQQERFAKQAQIEQTTEQLRGRLRANYMAGSTNWLEVLFQADSLEAYLTRSELFDRIAAKDKSLIETFRSDADMLKNLEKNLIAAQESLVIEQSEADTAKRLLQTEQKAAQENLAQQRAKEAELQKNIADKEAQIKKLNENSAAFADAQRRYIAQMDAVDAELQKAIEEQRKAKEQAAAPTQPKPQNSPASNKPASSYGLIFPLHVGKGQYYISSGYGMRLHPIYKVNRLHSGVDIPMPTGTPVYAMAAGTVIFSRYGQGVGYCVVIDHGDSLYTRYAHSSQLLVSEGEYVQQDQKIMLVGNSGDSSGAHLHIEVLIGGIGQSDSVDPRKGYVPFP
ncbi:MAG: peptidoglycan DD-metalloendopeptidase family protein [Oscillospiraceae bacterium]|jgi:murein DD-endopeptidase MepM/ murein hydrolase activator NlpD|nr:peptidoglycan DD-metalloendopeptidase family protein [Oscillospiraceae bacterium]